MPHLTFILVQPQMGENIGFAARAMSNFDITDLRIVSPRDDWPNQAAFTTCANGRYVLEQARVFNNLEEAIEDLNFVIATSANHRDLSLMQMGLRNFSPSYTNSLMKYNRIGVLFGKESSGLSNEALNSANVLINVETCERNPSLNLGHSVAILGYIMRNLQNYTQENSTMNDIQINDNHDCLINKLPEIATVGDILYLRDKLFSLLEQSSFFAERKEKITRRKIQSMFNRFSMTKEEVRLMHGIFMSISR